MPPLCKTCNHSERAEIDSRLARGEAIDVIAVDFSLPMASVRRHVTHVAALMSQSGAGDGLAIEVAEMEAQLTLELTAKINFLAKEAIRLKGVALQLADMRSAIALLRELTRINELKVRARELERARASGDGGGSGQSGVSPISPAAARKMAETYLTRHHVGDRLKELKEGTNAT